MMLVTAVQERGWMGQFPEGTLGGKWHWTLTGPAPQTQDMDDGGGVQFQVDEVASPGEYLITVQRLDVNGAPLGDSQSSSPFTIKEDVVPLVDVEIAGPVTVTIAKA